MSADPPHEWKVREYAALERVDPRTVRRWIDKGAIEARRTPGGGIRIPDPRGAVLFVTRPRSYSP